MWGLTRLGRAGRVFSGLGDERLGGRGISFTRKSICSWVSEAVAALLSSFNAVLATVCVPVGVGAVAVVSMIIIEFYILGLLFPSLSLSVLSPALVSDFPCLWVRCSVGMC